MNHLLIGCATAAGVGLFLFLRARRAAEWQISPAEIPALVGRLQSSPGPLAWAQLISDEHDGLALDYAVENGELQFNWCLLSPRNIADKDRFTAFLDGAGFSHRELKAPNGCPLIEVRGPGLEGLAHRILAGLYSVPATLRVVGEGFQWP